MNSEPIPKNIKTTQLTDKEFDMFMKEEEQYHKNKLIKRKIRELNSIDKYK